MHGPQPKADFRTYQTNYFTGRKSLARCSFYFHYYLIQSTPEYMTGLGFLPLGGSAHCPVLIAWKNFFFFLTNGFNTFSFLALAMVPGPATPEDGN